MTVDMIIRFWNRLTRKKAMWQRYEGQEKWECSECGYKVNAPQMAHNDRCRGCGREMLGLTTYCKDYEV